MWGAISDKIRICRLQLLLALASADIVVSESRGTRDHILLPQFQDSPNPVFLFPRTEWPSYIPRHWVKFRPATSPIVRVRVRVRVTLWLAVYPQSVRLGVRPLETHDQRFSPPYWTLAVIVLNKGWRLGRFIHSESVIAETGGNGLRRLVWRVILKVCEIAIVLWLSVIERDCNQSVNKIQSSELEPVIIVTSTPVHVTIL
jgi:hypothetical protein